jgi:hypothetical protein
MNASLALGLRVDGPGGADGAVAAALGRAGLADRRRAERAPVSPPSTETEPWSVPLDAPLVPQL